MKFFICFQLLKYSDKIKHLGHLHTCPDLKSIKKNLQMRPSFFKEHKCPKN